MTYTISTASGSGTRAGELIVRGEVPESQLRRSRFSSRRVAWTFFFPFVACSLAFRVTRGSPRVAPVKCGEPMLKSVDEMLTASFPASRKSSCS